MLSPGRRGREIVIHRNVTFGPVAFSRSEGHLDQTARFCGSLNVILLSGLALRDL